MKNRSFALALTILFAVFTVSTTIMAQSHDSKNSDNKGKTTVNKTETNKTEVKQTATTTTHHKPNQTKGGLNTVHSDVKTNPEKDMKKTENEIKLNDTMTHKPEKKSNEKIKN